MKKLLLCTASFIVLSISLVITAANAAPLPDITELIEKASPAIVKITGETKAKQSRQLRQVPNSQQQDVPQLFRELFQQRQTPVDDNGVLGSGFIVSNDGYVLTNSNIVSGADEITVILNDEREFTATLVGSDDRSNIALLKIDAKNLPQLNLSKNEKLKVGQWAFVLGSPFGLDISAAIGIVSAVGRNTPTDRNTVQFIQADIAVAPGSAGGPLVNTDGEVIGITSHTYNPANGSAGFLFAIPSSVAIDVMNQLKEKGRVERSWLGVVVGSVDKELASAYGLDKAQGAIVSEVSPDSPAEKAGVKVGDLIVKFHNQDVHSQTDLPRIIGQLAPGTKVAFEVIRKGKRETLSVTLEKLKDGSAVVEKSNVLDEPKTAKTDALGLAVAPANGAEKGVQVLAVEAGSAAQRAGIQRGDIITQLDFVDLDSVASYNNVIGAIPKNTAKAIRFVRGNTPIFRSITIK